MIIVFHRDFSCYFLIILITSLSSNHENFFFFFRAKRGHIHLVQFFFFKQRSHAIMYTFIFFMCQYILYQDFLLENKRRWIERSIDNYANQLNGKKKKKLEIKTKKKKNGTIDGLFTEYNPLSFFLSLSVI